MIKYEQLCDDKKQKKTMIWLKADQPGNEDKKREETFFLVDEHTLDEPTPFSCSQESCHRDLTCFRRDIAT